MYCPALNLQIQVFKSCLIQVGFTFKWSQFTKESAHSSNLGFSRQRVSQCWFFFASSISLSMISALRNGNRKLDPELLGVGNCVLQSLYPEHLKLALTCGCWHKQPVHVNGFTQAHFLKYVFLPVTATSFFFLICHSSFSLCVCLLGHCLGPAEWDVSLARKAFIFSLITFPHCPSFLMSDSTSPLMEQVVILKDDTTFPPTSHVLLHCGLATPPPRGGVYFTTSFSPGSCCALWLIDMVEGMLCLFWA